MFPIRDELPARRTPFVTWTIIAINVGVFGLAYWMGEKWVHAFALLLGTVPSVLLTGDPPWVLATPLTSMFMHGSWAHLLGNMWFLHVFGDNVEDELGHGRYLVFYLLAGLLAVAAHVALAPSGTLPLVGASGAIAGVLGAYMVRFPRAPVLTWIGFALIELPAFAFLFVWFAMQLVMTVGSLGAVEQGGVAFAAHAGGFVAGIVLDRVLGPDRQARERAMLERKRRELERRRAAPERYRPWLG